MAKKKLAKVQDIPGMKIYDGLEMYATDKRGGWPDLYWEAKRICHKVRITYIESPESEPQTLIIAPYKLESSVDGWAVGDLPSEGSALPSRIPFGRFAVSHSGVVKALSALRFQVAEAF